MGISPCDQHGVTGEKLCPFAGWAFQPAWPARNEMKHRVPFRRKGKRPGPLQMPAAIIEPVQAEVAQDVSQAVAGGFRRIIMHPRLHSIETPTAIEYLDGGALAGRQRCWRTEMSLQEDVRYLKDRAEIHERIAMYALGQDLHQPGWEDQDSYPQWSEVFSDDVAFDVSDTGHTEPVGLTAYMELMRGRKPDQPGIEQHFNLWAHLEHPVRIKIDGDEATSITLHVHMHETKEGDGNSFLVG